MKLFSFLLPLTVFFLQALQGQSQFFVDPYFVEPNKFEGWGTSLAWWPDVLGAMPEDVIDQVTKAFFSEDGLNLNIVRYTIGGTTPGNYTCGNFRAGGATESFKDGPDKPYDWTRDPRQRRILAIAKDLGADTFEAFSNSPPQWMTITGCSKGNEHDGPVHSNLDSSQASAYAEYIADVLDHFRTEWNMTFHFYAPFNEPFGILGDGFWTGANKEQEGCNVNPDTMVTVIRALAQLFKERGITTELTAADETQVDTAIMSQDYFRSQNITSLFTKVNTHGYWDSDEVRRDVLHLNSVKDGHRLWMDEVGWGESSLTDMTQGLTLATRVLKDLKLTLASAWVYWQAMEDVGAWGLLAVPYNNASVANIRYNNGFSAFKQFTKYIRKDFNLIYASNEYSLAAYDDRTQTLVVVVVNTEKERRTQSYKLDMFEISSSSIVSATRTSSSEQDSDITSEVLLGASTLMYTLPGESVSTLVVSNVTPKSRQLNLVANGDFERSTNTWGLTGEAGIVSFNPRFGTGCGAIQGGRGGSIFQSFRADTDGELFVSAWCSATSSATFKVEIVNEGAVRESVVRDKVYAPYGIVVPVRAGDSIRVVFEASGGDSYIDNVSVHYTN